MSVLDFFLFKFDYFNTSLCGIIALKYAVRLCSGGRSHIMPGLSYYRDSSEVLLCNFGVILVISEVLGKSFRQIKWCCSMASGGVCDESDVLYFS